MAERMLNRDWIWGEIPSGFTRVTDECRRRLVVREDLKKRLPIAAFLDEGGNGTSSPFQGRQPLRAVTFETGETALIRTYHHGGIFRLFTRRTFFSWPPRPFRELAITEELRRRGISTVVVCGACVEPVWGPFYRGWLATRRLDGAHDLWTALSGNLLGEVGMKNIWRAVADSLTQLHRQGVCHTDLNLKNILVRRENDGVKAYIIDFDKAVLFLGQVPERVARKTLARLFRSVCKLDPTRKYVPETDWDGFVNWYHGTAG
jgi:3-deoxy-D-manno-octulosonic acid kinase